MIAADVLVKKSTGAVPPAFSKGYQRWWVSETTEKEAAACFPCVSFSEEDGNHSEFFVLLSESIKSFGR